MIRADNIIKRWKLYINLKLHNDFSSLIYIKIGGHNIMAYNKRDADILTEAWDETTRSLTCPKCGSEMNISEINPRSGLDDDFMSFDTMIDCNNCAFKLRTESLKILGGVKDFDLKKISIGSWSNSGSRVSSDFEHVLDYDRLKKLKESGDLVEFLVVNKHVIDVIDE